MASLLFFRVSVVLTLGCVLPAFTAARQQDSQAQKESSVADAARRAREQKKNAAKAPAKVINDDNISATFKTGQDNINVMAPNPGTPEAAEQAGPKTDNTEAAQTTAKEAARPAQENALEIARVKEQIAQTEKELDLAKRELALDSNAYYAKTDFANDKAGKAKLDTEQQQIGDKQQGLETLKTRLAALEELEKTTRKAKPAASDADQNGTPPSSAPPQQ